MEILWNVHSWAVLITLLAVVGETIAASKPQTVQMSQDISPSVVERVHIIYMNHLDVGYNGQPEPGFVNYVLNRYFQEYFPRAARLGSGLTDGGFQETFVYTTHPWLVTLYMNCPPNLVLAGFKLKCPNISQVATFKDAVNKGYITWHAGPMNMQMEFMPRWLAERGLNISQELDVMFNISRKTKVLSQRDVPGLTHAIIPSLVKMGISAITVGVNSMTPPPAVPKILRWGYGKDEVIATWHPGGYPNSPGPDPKHPGGISRKDCLVIDNFPEALCFAFRTDNWGPPANVQEILGYYEILRKEFPGADIRGSTLEDFFVRVLPIRSKLPLVSMEIGDTWIQGTGTDPRKSAEYRATARVLGSCIENGECSLSDPRVWNATRLLTKLGEHTWGLPTDNDTVHWSNKQFYPVIKKQNFQNCTNSWLEQRNFTYLTISALETHKVVPQIRAELKKLEAKRPDLSDYVRFTADPSCSSPDFNMSIGKAGSIDYLNYKGSIWAASNGESFLSEFLYVTYDEHDYKDLASTYNYIPGISAGFGKTNATKNAHPISWKWPVMLTAAFRHKSASCDIWVHVTTVDDAPKSYYGAPPDTWIHYYPVAQNGGSGLGIELTWFDKPTTRLTEALFLVFKPNPACSGGHCEWSYSKLGRRIDPLNVMLNGSHYQHAVDDGGVYFTDQSDKGLQITSPDVHLACPITSKMTYPTVFPALQPITDNITGVGFNIYNNIWNTNFIFWYPYIPEDMDFKARFYIKFLN